MLEKTAKSVRLLCNACIRLLPVVSKSELKESGLLWRQAMDGIDLYKRRDYPFSRRIQHLSFQEGAYEWIRIKQVPGDTPTYLQSRHA